MTDRYAGRRVLVAGAGVAGAASARALLAAGALVTVVDRRDVPVLAELAAAGARIEIRETPGSELLTGVTDVVLSPGFAPHHPLAVAAVGAGLDVYSEPELAWRLRGPEAPPWLAVTGTNGKTTTTTTLAAILRAAGLRSAALGNIGEPLVFASTGETAGTGETGGTAGGYDVLAVELSSFQLHWSRELAPEAGAVLNVAEDHLDWHGDLASYAGTKTAVWRAADAGTGVAVGNLDDAWVASALSRVRPVRLGASDAAPRPGAVAGRTAGWTLDEPKPGQLGVVDGVLLDNAFASSVELAPVASVRPAGTHNVSNALAAAALARSFGVEPAAVRDGLAGYCPEPHRNAEVAVVGGVRYVDDSKATNPHAAYASLTAYPRIVWVAGGQLKGVQIDDLVARVAGRLVGAVLLGVDRAQIAAALVRHAPRLPVIDVASTDDGAMGEAVRAAAALAGPGDTVLLAPAAASLDMFVSYARRGDAFAAAVRAL